MTLFDTRFKAAFKVALAVTIAIALALGMDWEKPYWAAYGVIMISLATEGQSLNKGAMRILGTLVAVAVSLTLLAWFPQQRWWFMAVLSLYVGFCAYMMTGRKLNYFWFASGFVCVIIAVESFGSLDPFGIAVERTQETGMGVLVYSLISALLWPVSSRAALEDASRRFFAVQVQLFRVYHGLRRGEGRPEDAQPLRAQSLPLLNQVEQLLSAAQTESYQVRAARHSWRLFLRQSTALMETLGRWRTSLSDIDSLDLTRLLPNLDALWSELDLRFAQIERMLGGQAPERMPQAVTLEVDKAELRSLTHFQKATVAVAKRRLDRLEALSRSLFDCVRNLRGYGGPAAKPVPEEPPRRGLAIDPDRAQGVISVLAMLWISFLIGIYVDPPGGSSFVMLSTIFMMVIVQAGGGATQLALWMILGTVLAAVPYLFIMPHLSSYGELGLMIFTSIFAIGYLLSEPRYGVAKMGLLVQFVTAISVQNEQAYSFASYMESLTMTVLVGGLLVAVSHIPTSPRPEKVFLRQCRRFFRQAGFLMSDLALGGKPKPGLAGRLKAVLYRGDLLEVPGKLALCGKKIDHRAFPANTADQVQALVSRLYLLAFQIKDLVSAHRGPQAESLMRELGADLRALCSLFEKRFQLWADDPTAAAATSGEARAQLMALSDKFSDHLDATFRVADEEKLRDEDYENAYRLLGNFRGLSEAMFGYSRLADGINWAQWREGRF